MNILYCVPFWPHLYTPWMFREIAWLRARGHNLAVISMRQWHDGQINVQQFNLQDVPVLQVKRTYESDRQLLKDLLGMSVRALFTRTGRSLKQAIKKSGWRHGIHEWLWLKRGVAFVRKHNIEIMDSHWAGEAAFFARQIHLVTNIPYSVTTRGGDLCNTPSPYLPEIVQDAAAVMFLSHFLVKRFRKEIDPPDLPKLPPCTTDASKMRVRHHGLPRETIADKPVPQSDDVQIVATTGRLDPEKRHQDLIEAAASLADEFPNMRLLFIGGGQLQPKLEAQAKELGLAGRVEFTGAKRWEQVMELVRTTHVYVQPSKYEGFCMATLEAASQGLPVIATATGAHEQIVEHGRNGFIYQPGDVEGLRDALRATLKAGSEKRKEMGDQSLEIANEHFCFDKLMPRVESIMNAIRTHQPLPE